MASKRLELPRRIEDGHADNGDITGGGMRVGVVVVVVVGVLSLELELELAMAVA
jgi:hypothetical protein